MEFNINQHGNIIEVEGIIKTIANAESVIEALKNTNGNFIVLRIKESFGMPSSIIGYLVKLKDEGKQISLEVGSDILYELLDNLNLIKTFNVKKI
jgi:hypothetical protein